MEKEIKERMDLYSGQAFECLRNLDKKRSAESIKSEAERIALNRVMREEVVSSQAKLLLEEGFVVEQTELGGWAICKMPVKEATKIRQDIADKFIGK